MIAGNLTSRPPPPCSAPPYNSGVDYDGYLDSVPEDDYAELAEGTAEMLYRALRKARGRAWANVGNAVLPTWLDALSHLALL